MILSKPINSFLFRSISTLIYLTSQMNRTYGSINKPLNGFSKPIKIMDQGFSMDQSIRMERLQDQQKKQRQVISADHQNDEEQHKGLSRKSYDKHNKQMVFFFNLDQNAKLDVITEYKQKDMIKQLSILARQMLFNRQRSQVVWCAIQEAFISFLKPTIDQDRIRSISKYLHALGKGRRATRNYETHMALLLPHSTHQSFTQIVVTISRMGGMSEQFCHIVEKLYVKRKQQFSALELNLINYVLAKNGRKIDPSLIENLNNYPIRGIALMLKTYDRSNMMTPQILNKCIPAIIARKSETNFFDLKHLINVYTKYLHLDNYKLLSYFDQQYRILARNINQETLQEIWQHLPEAVNANKLPIEFVEKIMKSLKILRTRNRISERTWKKLALTFNKFQNLQIRTQLEKL